MPMRADGSNHDPEPLMTFAPLPMATSQFTNRQHRNPYSWEKLLPVFLNVDASLRPRTGAPRPIA